MINNSNDIKRAEDLVNSLQDTNKIVKHIKNDKGLMEKDQSSSNKIILTEDNRQVLFG